MATKANKKPCKTSEMEFFCKSLLASEANSESCQRSSIELFAKIVNNLKSSTVLVKTFILDVGQVSEYASELAFKVKDASFLNQFEYQQRQHIITFY